MKFNDWYDEFEYLEQSTKRSAQIVQQLKKTIQQLYEDNNRLVIENMHLRERLDALTQGSDEKTTIGMNNLEKLYHSGIHICHNFYGAKRDEMCLLCESLLSQHQD
ncbi:DUF972 family protein [Carnobacteriaceae bacterium zg-ZUI252]|nr:DUF972 family protein [Carnobacteriaceae bacterium zg-ZUI252]MBS4769768.1 DUF972 family protein [Carnobacteriaceae bacterium zg-ZUI240]QTU83177.1 DUF972 family protein [Carnobacteriaceae bacterium zg-C25]